MRILLIDDDPLSRQSMARFLRSYLQHEVTEAEDAEEGWQHFESEPFPLVISDIRMPGMGGLELLKRIKDHEAGANCDVVLVTGFGELESAVEALRTGATDYLQKPVNVDQLAMVVSKRDEASRQQEPVSQASIVEDQPPLSQPVFPEQTIHDVFGLGRIGIFSRKMHDAVEMTQKLHQDRSVNVLIRGETGTGKEVMARLVHFQDGEELLPFITLNCSAITPSLFESELFGYEAGAFTGAKSKGQVGKLELAQGGTLFLDEIGDLPPDMQPKLLRAIQMKEIYRIGGKRKIKLDVRLVGATNRDLEQMVEAGSFRRDLYYRLNTGVIEIPPLRDRTEEISQLTRLFLEDISAQKGKRFQLVNPEVEAALLVHDWPGNVRELRNLVERAVLLHDDVELRSEHLLKIAPRHMLETMSKPDELRLRFPEDQYPFDRLERDIIEQVLQRFDGNKSRTAEYLGITRNRLNRKLQS